MIVHTAKVVFLPCGKVLLFYRNGRGVSCTMYKNTTDWIDMDWQRHRYRKAKWL